MLIGVDFDNTIVSYEELFHLAARERDLIPDGVPAAKGGVRDYLRRVGREDDWTELQGRVYGALISKAPAFPGVEDFFARCRTLGVGVRIISHKTLQPFRGPVYDLHQAAHRWLEGHGFYDPNRMGLSREQVHFELTKQGKLDRIAASGCSHFIDDLPEFLEDPAFPRGVERILFDPQAGCPAFAAGPRAGSWKEIAALLLRGSGSPA